MDAQRKSLGSFLQSQGRKFLPALILLATTFSASAGDLPDPKLTPGVTNPAVTAGNIHSTICVKGWTKTIRPPEVYTTELKHKQIEEYGFTDKNLAHYEEDHLISLEIGGHPSDPKNLWPEHYSSPWGAKIKDKIENRLKALVCAGKLSLVDAQAAIATNWIAAYKKYMPIDPR